MAEEKKGRWSWLLDKLADAAINFLMAGVLLLIGWAVLQAFLGDYREEKLRDDVLDKEKTLRQEIIQTNNEAVKREALLLKRIEELAGAIDRMNRGMNLPRPPQIQPEQPQQPQPQPQPQEQRQAPPDARMDWIDRYEQNVLRQQQR